MRFLHSLPLLLLSLSVTIVQILAETLILPSNYDVTQVYRDDKNAGAFVDKGDEDDTDESIRWGSTASTRGSQLQLVTEALKALGEVEAYQSMLALDGVPVSKDQSLLISETVGSKLAYNNGPVLSQIKRDPLNIFITFYGRYWAPADKAIVETFIKALNPAVSGGENDRTVDRWWDITTRYFYDYKNRSIASNVVLKPSVSDSSSQWPFGSSAKQPLKDRNMRAIVTRSLNGAKPTRSSVHIVLTSPEVFVKNFGTTLCTYHSSFKLQKVNVAYIFAGNPATQALKECSYRYYDPMVETLNGVAIDALINWVAHSLTKTATNPYPLKKGAKGWLIAKTNLENGDICSWLFGYTGFTIVDKMKFYTWNINGGGKKFLIQQNYNPKIKKCVIIARNKVDDPIPLPPM